MTRCDDLAKTINGSFDFPAGALDNAAGGLTNWQEAALGLLPNSASKGIYLGTSSVAAEHLLDNYEEGTWTPAYSDGNTLAVTAYSLQIGRFIRIGHCVWIYGEIATNGITTQGSQFASLIITGLPFTVKNESFTRSALSISTCSTFAADQFPKSGAFNKNNTTISLTNFSSSDARDGYGNVLPNNMPTTSSDNRMEFSGHYRVA
tara:strand:+ start:186 stop:800 length:615 start_codon:yes stop_codon:yes gene_type:complete